MYSIIIAGVGLFFSAIYLSSITSAIKTFDNKRIPVLIGIIGFPVALFLSSVTVGKIELTVFPAILLLSFLAFVVYKKWRVD